MARLLSVRRCFDGDACSRRVAVRLCVRSSPAMTRTVPLAMRGSARCAGVSGLGDTAASIPAGGGPVREANTASRAVCCLRTVPSRGRRRPIWPKSARVQKPAYRPLRWCARAHEGGCACARVRCARAPVKAARAARTGRSRCRGGAPPIISLGLSRGLTGVLRGSPLGAFRSPSRSLQGPSGVLPGSPRGLPGALPSAPPGLPRGRPRAFRHPSRGEGCRSALNYRSPGAHSRGRKRSRSPSRTPPSWQHGTPVLRCTDRPCPAALRRRPVHSLWRQRCGGWWGGAVPPRDPLRWARPGPPATTARPSIP